MADSLWLYKFLNNKKNKTQVKCKSMSAASIFTDNTSRKDFCEAESVSYRFQSPGIDTITQDGEDGEGRIVRVGSANSIDSRVNFTTKKLRLINRTVTMKKPVFQLDFVHRLDLSAAGIIKLVRMPQSSGERLDVILQHFIHDGPRMRMDIQLELKNVIVLYVGVYTRVEPPPVGIVHAPVGPHAPEGPNPVVSRDLFALHRTNPYKNDVPGGREPLSAVYQKVSLQTTDVSVTYKDAENLNAAFMSDLFGETIVS